jgi:hypothetical protein
MATTTPYILAFAVLLSAKFASAQETKQQPTIRRYVVTMRDSTGKIIYSDNPEWRFAASHAPYDTVKVKRNWSRLKKGLSTKEVEALFGTARGVEADPENGFEYWWYGRRAVVFNSLTKKVSFWDK